MPKILHTADLHLKEFDDERWQALEELLKLAADKQAAALTISGDLFDTPASAQTLRDKIRPLFSQQPFQIIIIPGNHDAGCFSAGEYYGENTKIFLPTPVNLTSTNNPAAFTNLSQTQTNTLQLDKNTTIAAIPFAKISQEQLLAILNRFQQTLNPKHHNLLLVHGELTDLFFDSADFGEEGSKRYLPFSLEMLTNTSFDYVLAGHFHSKFHLKKIDNKRLKEGGFFVYPGSPVSITTKEMGLRSAALIEIGKTPQQLTLNTQHYQTIEQALTPDSTQDFLAKTEKQIQQLPEKAVAVLRVSGYFDQAKIKFSEQELYQQLIKLTQVHRVMFNSENYSAKDISQIFSSNLYQKIAKKIEQTTAGDLEQELALKTALIEALIQS